MPGQYTETRDVLTRAGFYLEYAYASDIGHTDSIEDFLNNLDASFAHQHNAQSLSNSTSFNSSAHFIDINQLNITVNASDAYQNSTATEFARYKRGFNVHISPREASITKRQIDHDSTSDNASSQEAMPDTRHSMRHHGKNRPAESAALTAGDVSGSSDSHAPAATVLAEPTTTSRSQIPQSAPPKNRAEIYLESSRAHKLMKIAHLLHYCSIVILGLFVVQFLIKMICMGLEFFKDKVEVKTRDPVCR